MGRSSIRLQWGLDHNPMGETLRKYSRDWIVKIENITEFVQHQCIYRKDSKWTYLITPKENVYLC
ncbi:MULTISPECIES: hypothetical protein [Okeania]|uniref:hypothetical protein n=1 Tax=Okeania TaxID=1458928 RepID=UPI001EFF821F|nr:MULTISPECIES: hypothetical protein [Okeania]